MQGLLNGAPYLCSAVIGCWMNAPLNKAFGRRGTIFISCFISFVTGFWMAAADSCMFLNAEHVSLCLGRTGCRRQHSRYSNSLHRGVQARMLHGDS